MTRNEQNYYNDVSSIEKSLKRIASALENSNVTKVDSQVNETLQAEENEELDTHHDYLHGLVQDLDTNAYNEFCNTHCLRANDAVEVSNYITDLDYDEVLGIIKELEEEYPFGGKSDDQANEDVLNENEALIRGHEEESFTDTSGYETDLQGIRVDSDHDIRTSAVMYNEEIHPASDIKTKKDAILDYVTNEFGSHGARYTDIIKFAYYLGAPNAPKYNNSNRGYYACALTHGRWHTGHLVTGGKDQLVKGINKDGDERYFAESFVESVTDYWRYLDK